MAVFRTRKRRSRVMFRQQKHPARPALCVARQQIRLKTTGRTTCSLGDALMSKVLQSRWRSKTLNTHLSPASIGFRYEQNRTAGNYDGALLIPRFMHMHENTPN